MTEDKIEIDLCDMEMIASVAQSENAMCSIKPEELGTMVHALRDLMDKNIILLGVLRKLEDRYRVHYDKREQHIQSVRNRR